MIEWGGELPTLREIQASTGVTPKALESMVELRDDCAGYYEVFSALSMTREYNQAGVQPLRVTEIRAYLDELRLSGLQREIYLHILMKLDAEFMRITFEKRPEQG